MPPPELAPKLLRLPPILHMVPRCSMPGYSKGSRGLSVLPQEHGICTATPISLSLQSRQWGIRYAIRAGRNLPDKEFRSILLLLRCLRLLALAFSFWLESHKRFWVGHSFSYVIRIRPLTALAAEGRPLQICLRNQTKGSGHFCHSLHIAMQSGLYLFHLLKDGIWRTVSEDSSGIDNILKGESPINLPSFRHD